MPPTSAGTPVEWCRRCRDLDAPQRPAEFVVWGKLFDPCDLGPRCSWHLPESVRISRVDQYAILDLRPLRRVS